jgi:Putative transmembrane protein (PGPGW)
MSHTPRSPKKIINPAFRYAMVILGWVLILGAVAIGPLPGPGPMILAPIGLAIILKNSLWAKKRYARFVRMYPEYGGWMDWAMRRKKVSDRPPAPDIKRDIMHVFRRDDINQKMP